MPSTSQKQKRFFGAVMGAKEGQKGVTSKAKKVAKEMPKKEIKKFLKTENEEDEQSVSKQLKETGKAVVKGPKVKERKHFAPATKVEKPKKGPGSYERKPKNDRFDESVNIQKFIEAILSKNYASADKYIKQAVESKLQRRIEQELSTPLF